ncbi:MAG: domain 2 [Bacteroidota bacterium]|jgi:hypothetical protein
MEYYLYGTDGNKIGPLQQSELKQYNITDDTLIWREGFTDWIQFSELPEYSSLIEKIPPPVKKNDGLGCGGEIAIMILSLIGAFVLPFLWIVVGACVIILITKLLKR